MLVHLFEEQIIFFFCKQNKMIFFFLFIVYAVNFDKRTADAIINQGQTEIKNLNDIASQKIFLPSKALSPQTKHFSGYKLKSFYLLQKTVQLLITKSQACNVEKVSAKTQNCKSLNGAR